MSENNKFNPFPIEQEPTFRKKDPPRFEHTAESIAKDVEEWLKAGNSITKVESNQIQVRGKMYVSHRIEIE